MAWWDKFPYTDYSSFNVDYWIQKFKQISDEWANLYDELKNWKVSTTEELLAWRNEVETSMREWENALRSDLEDWKTETQDDISEWETEINNNLNTWKTSFEELFNTTFNNLVQIKTDAEAARDRAIIAETNANASAQSILQNAEQIEINKNNIEIISEHTRNINIAEVGKYFLNSNNIISQNNNAFGLNRIVECKPNTTYTASFYNAVFTDTPNGYAGLYDVDGNFLEKTSAYTAINNSFTFTTSNLTYYIYVYFYKSGGVTIDENSKIQIEKGAEKTDYVLPLNPRGFDELNQNDKQIYSEIAEINNKINANVISIRLIEPDLFSWKDSPLHEKIKTNHNDYYIADFNIENYKNNNGVVKYVSPNGNDINSGNTKDSPLLSMATAFNSGADTIILLPGIYRRNNTLRRIEINRNLNIIGDNTDGDIIISSHNRSVGWTRTAGFNNVFSVSRSVLTNVVDIINNNQYGDYTLYTHYDNISDVENNPGSWAHINGVAYVHTISNIEPTEENGILLMAGETGTPLFNITNGRFYIENVVLLEGSSPIKAHAETSSTVIEVYGNNCKCMYSLSIDDDVIMMQGVTLAIFNRCEASYGLKDGFNYHSRNNIIPKAIEIDCIGKFDGNSEDANDQGTTIHDGGKIIRINDIITKSYGANIADTGENTESWNINCVCFEQIYTNSESQACNFWAGAGSKMFLDGCRGFGSKYNVYANPDSTTIADIYLRNNIFSGTLYKEGVSKEPIYY